MMAKIAAALLVVLTVPLFAAQVSFERTISDLASPDAAVRLKAARLLKQAPYEEAAVPLAKAITDTEDDVQLEAIAAELNIYLAQRIVPRRRVALVIEARSRIAGDVAFSQGRIALNATAVPPDVTTALRAAARDQNPHVAFEALYVFGALAADVDGSARQELLQASAPVLAGMLGALDPAFRFAALRVIGRVFERRVQDAPVDRELGDAVTNALNDVDRGVRREATLALGAMRYERAVQSLADLFQYLKQGDLAAASLDSLARIAHASSTELFVSQLTARAPGIKGIAIEGLARLGDRTKLAAIQSALVGERDDGALLAGTYATVVLAGAPVDQLADALTRPKLHDQAWGYLREIAPGRTSAFSRCVRDPDARIRADIADLLGVAGDPAALPLVESMLKDVEPEVALAAERAAIRLRRS